MKAPPDAQEAAELLGAPHEPCPFCLVEVRNLSAVAYNLCVRFPNDPRLDDLRQAVKLVEPLSDRHFGRKRNG